jgi:endogenous inhibitor of DNA gyrase (YacG/DUF329 family)
MAEEEVRAQCPRCGVLIRWGGNPYRPFCSERCKLIDLGQWVDEGYRLDGEKASDADEKEGRGGGS